MYDLFGVYLGHGCLITHQFFQAEAFKKKLVMIKSWAQDGEFTYRANACGGGYSHPGF